MRLGVVCDCTDFQAPELKQMQKKSFLTEEKKKEKNKKDNKSFLLSVEVEHSCRLPKWSSANQNICLEEKSLLTLSIAPRWSLADAWLSCKRLRARTRSQGWGSQGCRSRLLGQEDRLPAPPPPKMLLHELCPGVAAMSAGDGSAGAGVLRHGGEEQGGMGWRAEGGGRGQEKRAHLSGCQECLWGPLGVRGFITKLHRSVEISAGISTQTYLLIKASTGQTC